MQAEPAASFAERATKADLDELIAALSDEALAHLALASARQLRRRLARNGGGRPAKGKVHRRGPLDRAGAALAAEWATAPDEGTW